MANEIEDFDIRPPAQGLGVVQYKHLELTPDEKLQLVQGASSTFYAVFVKLMEGEVTKAETFHFQQWKNKELFERTGLIAVAQRLFLERLTNEVKHQIDEFSGELDFARQKKEQLKQTPESVVKSQLQIDDEDSE